jgi:hypothetical protein
MLAFVGEEHQQRRGDTTPRNYLNTVLPAERLTTYSLVDRQVF